MELFTRRHGLKMNAAFVLLAVYFLYDAAVSEHKEAWSLYLSLFAWSFNLLSNMGGLMRVMATRQLKRETMAEYCDVLEDMKFEMWRRNNDD